MQRYALLSVFDKEGVSNFAAQLSSLGYQIISTGGTAKILQENNIKVIPIAEITGNPESFDGRMKTVSFQIESGILYDRDNAKHVEEARKLKIKPIDLVVCNLYPFEQTIAKPHVSLSEAVEQIDVGGPTMVRSAGKNFKHILVVTDPHDYQEVIEKLKLDHVPLHFKKRLAAKAFAHLSFYDAQIANYLREEQFPAELTLPLRKSHDLRYGENPHQKSALYLFPNTKSVFQNLIKRAGRDLSLTNISDINAGVESVRLFKEPCAVVIKHNNPCGIALGKSSKEALMRAIEADPESAFGGVIVLNLPMDLKTARLISSFKKDRGSNIDIVAVPKIDQNALELLMKTRKTMGIYTFGTISKVKPRNNIKWIDGGLVVQESDDHIDKGFKDWKVVSKKKPSAKQILQMKTAWKFISRIKSNAIIIMDPKNPMTRGIGTGQTSRIRSTKIALEQAGKHTKSGIMASDSFFPFDDSVKMAGKYGISAIVQQGGSINDQLSIQVADKQGMIMVFTGKRAFWH